MLLDTISDVCCKDSKSCIFGFDKSESLNAAWHTCSTHILELKTYWFDSICKESLKSLAFKVVLSQTDAEIVRTNIEILQDAVR